MGLVDPDSCTTGKKERFGHVLSKSQSNDGCLWRLEQRNRCRTLQKRARTTEPAPRHRQTLHQISESSFPTLHNKKQHTATTPGQTIKLKATDPRLAEHSACRDKDPTADPVCDTCRLQTVDFFTKILYSISITNS